MAQQRALMLGAGLIAVVAAAVAAGLIYLGRGEASTPMADLAPADTHMFIALNTDLASRPWLAMPGLLGSVEAEDDLRTSLEEAFAEIDLDYETDVEPLLGTMRGASLAVHVPEGALSQAFDPSAGGSGPDVEIVFMLDSREPDDLLALIERGILAEDPDAVREESRDDARGLDIVRWTTNQGSGDGVIARDGDVFYIAEHIEHVQALIDRRESGGPLSATAAYQRMQERLAEDAIVFGFGSAAAFDDPALQEFLEQAQANMEFDFTSMSLGFAMTATSDGFGGEFVLANPDGFGEAAEAVYQPAALSRAAGAVPEQTLFFVSGAGLRESLESALQGIDEAGALAGFFGFAPPMSEPGGLGSPPDESMVDQLLEPLEQASGVDVREDIIARLSGTSALAAGGEDIEALDGFVAVLTESTDNAGLVDAFERLVLGIEQLCACATGVSVSEGDGFVRVGWPDPLVETALAAPERLSGTAGFQRMLLLLPEDPAGLLYFNFGALPPGMTNDPELAEDVNLEAIEGLGIGWSGDEESVQASFVIPIRPE